MDPDRKMASEWFVAKKPHLICRDVSRVDPFLFPFGTAVEWSNGPFVTKELPARVKNA